MWALFPTADTTTAYAARHHAILSHLFALTTPPWEIHRWAHDKRLTHELADTAGVEYPSTLYPHSREVLAQRDVRFPVVLKPAVKEQLNRFTRAKAWRADDRNTLLRRYDEAVRFVAPEFLMVQELIPGGGGQLSYAALAENGRVLCWLTARRTRQYPADFGRASTFVETIDDPGIGDASRRLIAASRWTGLIEIEYKVDARTGRTLLLDLNPRVWGWHSLCASRRGLSVDPVARRARRNTAKGGGRGGASVDSTQHRSSDCGLRDLARPPVGEDASPVPPAAARGSNMHTR